MVAIGIPWQGTGFAREAEALGVEAFCTGDFVDHEAYVSMAEMVHSTGTALIGSAVAYAFARTPFAHASALRQLYSSAGERLFLGLGTGAYSLNRDWLGVAADRPASRMGELISVIRAFLEAENGESVTYAGEFYNVNARIAAPVLGRIDVPILVGAFNQGMARMAGRRANGVIGHGLFTTKWWNETIRPQVTTAAQKAGRGRDLLEYGWVITAINDDDPQRAALDARRMIGFYFTVATYDSLAEMHGWEEPVSEIRSAFKARDSNAMAAAVTDEMLEAIAIFGTTDQARQMWRSRGVDGLPADVAFLSPPSYLVSSRRRQAYARASMRLKDA
ncbi:MAG: 5,10-methylene tetrahydromethanopterin reductase [Gordonia sp.]|nr:5,10-methylene tetrahydromethanopterin reductase [Gordonia sp. (in: high G+C Gram-positive bacteria)]